MIHFCAFIITQIFICSIFWRYSKESDSTLCSIHFRSFTLATSWDPGNRLLLIWSLTSLNTFVGQTLGMWSLKEMAHIYSFRYASVTSTLHNKVAYISVVKSQAASDQNIHEIAKVVSANITECRMSLATSYLFFYLHHSIPYILLWSILRLHKESPKLFGPG